MLNEPTPSDPIQNRKLTKKCWNGQHHAQKGWIFVNEGAANEQKYWGDIGCDGWFYSKGRDSLAATGLRCECLCHEATPAPRVRKLKPSDSLDLPDVGTMEIK